MILAGPEFTRVLDRSRDNLNRDTGWELKESAGVPPASFNDNQATYSYSPTDGRLTFVSGGGLQPPSQFNYTYLPNSNLLTTITGPTHTVTNTWEATRDVLATKENKVGTTVISGYTYNVNHLGQRTGVSTTGTAFAATGSIDWGYNNKGEVVKADSSVNAADRAYQYDGIGNRLQGSAGVSPAVVTDYTPNALNQYTAITQGSAGVSPAYDDDGNATAYPLPANPGSNSTLVWDAENRLTSTSVNSVTTTYLYDSQSRRIASSTTINNQLSTIIYIYDGWNPIAEYSTSTLSKTYTWGMDLSGSMQGAGGVGGLLAVTDSVGSHFPTYDGNGNISEYLDSSGAIAAHYEYDPFGRETVSNGTNPTGFAHRFSTKPVDSTTGLHYYGYRYYDSATGRWPSRDPIGERGGINLYGFISNRPTFKSDRFGLIIATPDDSPPPGYPPFVGPPNPPSEPKLPDISLPVGATCNCEKIVKCGCCPERFSCGDATVTGKGTAYSWDGDQPAARDAAIFKAQMNWINNVSSACQSKTCPKSGNLCTPNDRTPPLALSCTCNYFTPA